MNNGLEAYAQSLTSLCGSSPVGIAFCEAPPVEVSRIARPAASGCTYWKLAEQGQVFYTEAADHYGCAVGAYTHGAELPLQQAQELSGLLGTMMGLSYVQEDEVAHIPRRTEPLRFVVYAPLSRMPCPPDLVIARGTPKKLMLLCEASRLAAHDATAGEQGAYARAPAAMGRAALPIMGRPACSLVPQSLSAGDLVTSLGCVGNRVYTDLPDSEGYVALPAALLPALCARLRTILEANEALATFHQDRRQAAEARAEDAAR